MHPPESARKWRKALEQMEMKGLLTAVALISAGAIGLIWAAVKAKLGKKGARDAENT